MRSKASWLLFILLVLVPAGNTCLSQPAWYYQWSLLPGRFTDLIAGESSGEQAYNHIVRLSEYNRQRVQSEFADLFFETAFVKSVLELNRLADITVEKLGPITVWNPVIAEVYEVSPNIVKIISLADQPFSIIPGSSGCDITAPLVWIGQPTGKDLDALDLKGKIVLTSSRESSVRSMLLQKEVAGVISYLPGRSYTDDKLIPDPKGYGIRKQGPLSYFGFVLSPADGNILKDRLLSGEKIILKVKIKTRNEDSELQVLSALIPGYDKKAGEIIITAHLFEGYGNQGANDNSSGSAAILEAAVALNRLISSGSLPQPRRTIRFLWVPEFSGTIPWANKHKEIIDKTLCNINLDMAGLSLAEHRSYFVLHRTSYGNAHYINDVVESFFRYTGETNQVNSVTSADRFTKRIVAPSGTEDPFYYQIETSSGGSDHMVFNDPGIKVPGVMMITWPDPFYHTSADRADKTDPTQLKRAVFITAASAYSVASASESEAIDFAGEILGNSLKRTGYLVAKGMDQISKADAATLYKVLSRASGEVSGAVAAEIRTLNSLNELSPGSEKLSAAIRSKQQVLANLTLQLISEFENAADSRADQFGMKRQRVNIPDDIRKAAMQIPIIKGDASLYGYGMLYRKTGSLTDAQNKLYDTSGVADTDEAFLCIDGKTSILDIKYMLDAQNEKETSLRSLISFMKLLKEEGLVTY